MRKFNSFLHKSLLLILSLFLLSIQEVEAKKEKSTNTNPSLYVTHHVWKQVKDYLMPDDHPIKDKLDHLFSNSRAICDQNAMKAASFITSEPRHHNHMIIATHPSLKGYLIKAYLDEQEYFEGKPEYYFWIKRIKGAELIQEFIKTHQCKHLFKVPRKWIYLLPDDPSPPAHYLRKMFILVVEDMNIFEDKTNEILWGSNWVNKELLRNLYSISTKLGLFDSTKPDNCPFSIDGKVAFIDTEIYHSGRVKYDKLTPYLSWSMRNYWKKLTKNE